MNYLAHLYPSEPDDDALLGSLMGDFVKGPLDDRYVPAIMRGIALHRRIDTFTDAHPVVQTSKARVSAERRRYAGIMVDMFYDHFLARYWPEFSEEPLVMFTHRVYEILARRSDILPERLREMAPHMMRTDWLGSYAHVEAIHTALNNMGRRLRRENRLLDSADELEQNYAGFEQDFREFLPEVKLFAGQEFPVRAVAGMD
ncbi:MAG TPA: ACP phosphodiesterase [Burkholderiales bacterium]